MILERVRFLGPSRMLDSEEHFFEEMLSVVGHADPNYQILIDKRDTETTVHITPSDSLFRKQIIDNLLHFNRKKAIYRIHFSSSLAISRLISFKVLV
jgi:hypothetical protein